MRLTRGRLALMVVAAVALAAAAFGTVYFTLFNPKAVAKVALPTPVPVASASAGSSPAALGATWKVTGGSFVGYRVREQLARLPAPTDAVGRTSAVTGNASVSTNADGTAKVTGIDVKADLAQLTSDSGRRDNFVQGNALDTAQFPAATFVSSAAFSVPATVVSGTAGQATVNGKLTVHGVAREVAIPLKIQRSASGVNIVGSYTFHWGDFGVQAPNVPVASVQGDPTIEISLVLTPA